MYPEAMYIVGSATAYGWDTPGTVEKTGDLVVPEYPEAMYIVGSATAYGWDTPGTVDAAVMHKCAGGGPSEGIFWKRRI